MSETEQKTHNNFVLPPTIVTRVDVSRLMTDFERVDEEMISARIRGQEANAQPSAPLQAFIDANQLSLDNDAERTRLIAELRSLKDKVPVIHITFASQADDESLNQMMQWFRTDVHPQVVIATSVQPALIAGIALRTPNHIHDMSLNGVLHEKHDVLVKHLEALRG